MLLTIPPSRRDYEAARAAEIREAERAVSRERLLWFGAGLASVWVGIWMALMGFHSDRVSIANVWIGAGLVIGEVGPLVVVLLALRREEM